jgi:hypothetical protein
VVVPLGGRENQMSVSCKEIAGGSGRRFGKFSKVGQVNACMRRKNKTSGNFGKENKSGHVNGNKRV